MERGEGGKWGIVLLPSCHPSGGHALEQQDSPSGPALPGTTKTSEEEEPKDSYMLVGYIHVSKAKIKGMRRVCNRTRQSLLRFGAYCQPPRSEQLHPGHYK